MTNWKRNTFRVSDCSYSVCFSWFSGRKTASTISEYVHTGTYTHTHTCNISCTTYHFHKSYITNTHHITEHTVFSQIRRQRAIDLVENHDTDQREDSCKCRCNGARGVLQAGAAVVQRVAHGKAEDNHANHRPDDQRQLWKKKNKAVRN